MGVEAQPLRCTEKFCKVTVHKAESRHQPERPRRQTIANYAEQNNRASHRRPTLFPTAQEVSSRRRANTSAEQVQLRNGRVLNPLSRMTMRQDRVSERASTPEDANLKLSNPLNDSFLDIDTDVADPERKTLDDDTAFFQSVGTPPIPAGLTVDYLPTEFFTPEFPSHMLNANATASGDAETEYDSEYDPNYDPLDDDSGSSVLTTSYADPDSDGEDMNFNRGRRGLFPKDDSTIEERKPRFPSNPRGRNTRGMSSPPMMVSKPMYQRFQSVPANGFKPEDFQDVFPEPVQVLRHGQTLHLAFNTSEGDTVQVGGRQKRSSATHMFSKRIRCVPVKDDSIFSNVDALRLIGHTTDGEIRGGDRISLARRDGTVLRIQKMSRKLCFSSKIDAKAKFIVCGVPERTPVTDTTKFYLQSVYDRSKIVGFLRSHKSAGSGCLVMYAYRSKDDKSEPIQLFMRKPTDENAANHIRVFNDGVQF